MSKPLDREEVIKNKKRGINYINNLLEGYISRSDCLKKANLISYWLKDYANMLRFEESFDPKKNIRYTRGDIVKVNFGFRVGSEFGGLHYAVIFDKHNARNSPVVTVIPLTSNNEDGSKLKGANVDIGDELYQKLKLKRNTLVKNINYEISSAERNLSTFLKLKEIVSGTSSGTITIEASTPLNVDVEDMKSKLDDVITSNRSKIEEMRKKNGFLEKIGREVSKMKTGSVALSNQITTISKIRIQDPKTSAGVLAGIRLSEESMKLINERIKDFYIF